MLRNRISYFSLIVFTSNKIINLSDIKIIIIELIISFLNNFDEYRR